MNFWCKFHVEPVHVSKFNDNRAAVLPSLPVEPRGAPVGGRPVSGAHAAEKTANKRLGSAAFVRAAMLELKGEREALKSRESPYPP